MEFLWHFKLEMLRTQEESSGILCLCFQVQLLWLPFFVGVLNGSQSPVITHNISNIH